MIITANKENFNELINDELVLVDFFATWCGPCKMLSPILEEISNERSTVKIVKVDIDQNRELTRAHGIMSVPTLVLFRNGEILATQNGYLAKDELMSWIESNKK